MSYFSQGLATGHAPQHTTHAPRGRAGDWGGPRGRAIDRYWSQGPHTVWCVTATPTQRGRKQQDGPHVLLPAYGAVVSAYTGTCPGLSPPSIPPGHNKYKKPTYRTQWGVGGWPVRVQLHRQQQIDKYSDIVCSIRRIYAL